jgi:hypothetical protein
MLESDLDHLNNGLVACCDNYLSIEKPIKVEFDGL